MNESYVEDLRNYINRDFTLMIEDLLENYTDQLNEKDYKFLVQMDRQYCENMTRKQELYALGLYRRIVLTYDNDEFVTDAQIKYISYLCIKNDLDVYLDDIANIPKSDANMVISCLKNNDIACMDKFIS